MLGQNGAMTTIEPSVAGVAPSRVVLGLMRAADLGDEQLRTLVRTARDAGVTVFDHADIYGGAVHGSEERFGASGAVPPAERDQVLIQSKAGIGSGWYDCSADHLIARVEGSLRALRTDYLDLLLLHRPDALVEPEEVARAFDALHEAGKVRQFGVSNHTPGQIALLAASVRQPLVVNQMQLSIAHAPMVVAGLVANAAVEGPLSGPDSGLIDHHRLHGITIQAWSPFQGARGLLLGPESGYPDLAARIEALASEHGVAPEAIPVAWILRHPARMQVVLGSTTPERVSAAAAGVDVALSRPEWYGLFTAAGHPLP